ncbi:MAG: helix-turn-helix domain-containing protein [Rubrobacter sp.]
MSGHKNFKALRDKVVADPERRKRVEELGRVYDVVLRLADLRESRGVTQSELAGTLGVSQPNVSKIERNEDVHLSTLGDYVAALGGRLEINAVFPDHPEQTMSIVVAGDLDERTLDKPEATRR